MPTEQETTQQIIANSKSVPQLPEVFSFEDGDYIPLFNVTTQQLVKIKKSNIVFTGETVTTINGLTDTPSSKLGQAGKVLLVSQDETTHEYKLLSEVTGITAQSIIDALTYTPADDAEVVKSVNGTTPDIDGNVVVATGSTYDDTALSNRVTALEGAATPQEPISVVWNTGDPLTFSLPKAPSQVDINGSLLSKWLEDDVTSDEWSLSGTTVTISPTDQLYDGSNIQFHFGESGNSSNEKEITYFLPDEGKFINSLGAISTSGAYPSRRLSRLLKYTSGMTLKGIYGVADVVAVFYNANFVLIGNLTINPSENVSATLTSSNVPANTAYLRFNADTRYNPGVDGADFKAVIPTYEYFESVPTESITDFYVTPIFPDAGKFFNSTGIISTSGATTTRRISYPIRYKSGMKANGLFGVAGTVAAFYDENLTVISTLSVDPSVGVSVTLTSGNVPVNTVYVRFNFDTRYAPSVEGIDYSNITVTQEAFINKFKSLPTVDDFQYLLGGRQLLNPSFPKKTTGETIKILLMGSSWGYDTSYLVRDVALESGISVDFGNIYIPGINYETLVSEYNLSTTSGFRFWAGNGAAMTSTTYTLNQAITHTDWDIIIIQQSAMDGFHWNTFQPFMEQWIHIIKSIATKPNVYMAMNHGWTPVNTQLAPYGFSTESEAWQATLETIPKAMHQSGIDALIPTGMAVYSARTTSLSDARKFSRDDIHIIEGIGKYLLACTLFEALIKPAYDVSILGNTYTSIDTTPTSTYEPVTATNREILQKIAISATAKRLNYTDLSNL